jgi:multidrug efflux system membrane fusion protein
MKRAIYLIILLAVAAAFYVYAYPRLSGGAADAQSAAPASNAAAGANAAAGSATPGNGRPGRPGGPGAGFPAGVVTAVALKQTLPITKSAVGYIEPANTVVVRARANGVVTAVGVEEGQTVKAGDLLFKLDDSAQQAIIAKDQATIAKDQAILDSAQATLAREQDLVKKQVDPQSALDTDTAAAKVAAASIAVDQAQLRADQVVESYMTILAPIDGRVGTVNTSVGNLVSASDNSAGGLVTITQMSPLRVAFSIPEGSLDGFRAALAGSSKLPVAVTAPGDTAPRAVGTLSFIDSTVDTGSGTVVIKATVDNGAGKLWPGQYVSALTQLGTYTDVTTVPLVAVQQSANGPYVFRVGGDSKVRKLGVTLVTTLGDTAIVSGALQPGDHVVVEGQLRLADGATVRETVQGDPPAAGNGRPGRDTGAGAPVASGADTATPANGAPGANGSTRPRRAPAAAAGNS